MKNRLLLGSGNLGKLKEIQFYLNYFSIYLGYEVITTKDLNNLIEPVEDALTFQENAKIKSQHYFMSGFRIKFHSAIQVFISSPNQYIKNRNGETKR